MARQFDKENPLESKVRKAIVYSAIVGFGFVRFGVYYDFIVEPLYKIMTQ